MLKLEYLNKFQEIVKFCTDCDKYFERQCNETDCKNYSYCGEKLKIYSLIEVSTLSRDRDGIHFLEIQDLCNEIPLERIKVHLKELEMDNKVYQKLPDIYEGYYLTSILKDFH